MSKGYSEKETKRETARKRNKEKKDKREIERERYQNMILN